MAAPRHDVDFRLADLLAGVPVAAAAPAAWAEVRARGLALDSRGIAAGDLFLALPGIRQDGRDFMVAAAGAGAVAVLAEAAGLSAYAAALASLRIPVIPVAGLAAQVSAIAGRFYGDPGAALTITGVTGTNGKTTCTQLLAQLFAVLEAPAGVIGTLGAGVLDDPAALAETGLTTPDAIAMQRLLADFRDRGVRRVAIEVSSHSLDQQRVAAVPVHVAIFTNLSRDHLDYHGDMAAYRAAKAQLFRQPGLASAVINLDDPAGAELLGALPDGVVGHGYSARGATAAIRAIDAEFSAAGVRARVATPWGEGALVSGLPGRFNLANLLAVIGAACAQGFALAAVLAAVPQLRAAPGRMQSVGGAAGPRVVVDYAHTPDALEQVLAALRESVAGGRLWCVFGCGGERDRGKRPRMGAIAVAGADRVVVTSDNPRGEAPDAIIAEILSGVAANQRDRLLVIPERRAAIARAIADASPADIVLLAGKGHETWQEIAGVRWPCDDAAEARRALAAREGRS
ncbi:MAG: UDP-N-acetylmuramoyl-L-alanyl-D-glutamate--2,6-diaminopimelate ligase [Gammaproteobacteria bacterium]|nr:UDP-N-acetylmuramoyl-L-alanyl-D-glutamate--2,6-diaminopimelate ligase [Gammaproteobacteria bacterium]